jgi:peptidoglycan/LPS O-acetylase OafA/YrhL
LLWFALPGSISLLLALVRKTTTSCCEPSRRQVQALFFAVCTSAMYVAALSLGRNKADRFIFPAYFILGVAGSLVAVHRWERVNRLAQRLARLPPYALPLMWLALFLLALPFELYVPYVKFRTD